MGQRSNLSPNKQGLSWQLAQQIDLVSGDTESQVKLLEKDEKNPAESRTKTYWIYVFKPP